MATPPMPKVLVIDDETAIRDLLYDTLKRKGYEVVTAISGSQVFETLKANRPQVILLDTSMPGLSGLETAQRIRNFDDAVPIILLKGAGEPEFPPEQLKDLGISDVIRKELGVELFLNAIDLALKRLQRDAAAQPGVQAMPARGTILAIDDDLLVRQLVKAFFEPRGLRVILAESGEAGVKAATQQKPDLVLLDMNMPGMDGLLTLKKIKAIRPNLPVIMATGVGEEAVVREALQSGAYDYVTKPFNLEYLETVVMTKVLLGIEG